MTKPKTAEIRISRIYTRTRRTVLYSWKTPATLWYPRSGFYLHTRLNTELNPPSSCHTALALEPERRAIDGWLRQQRRTAKRKRGARWRIKNA